MITLQITHGDDFNILNLTDPQLSDGEWDEGAKNGVILRGTVGELMEKTRPDLVTVSGDIAWAGQMNAYECFRDMMDGYKTPWAVVWGNHDNQGGAETVNKQLAIFEKSKYFLYEKGDEALGNGNYVIRLAHGDTTAFGVIMMDSHDRAPYTDGEGKTSDEWAKFTPEQIQWYEKQVASLDGAESCLIAHIPIYAYREAFEAAWNSEFKENDVLPGESGDGKYWNDGYKGSFGVRYEGICSYPADEGMFDAILRGGSTKTVVAGHDHVNNYVINHKGVKFVYSLKTGPGCYWNDKLNGGTLLTVSDGCMSVEHVFVDPRKFAEL